MSRSESAAKPVLTALNPYALALGRAVLFASACSIRDTEVWPSVSRYRMNFDADLTVRQLLTLSTVEFAAYRDWWGQIRELLSPQRAADIEQQLRREADALNRLAVLPSRPGASPEAHL